MRGRPSTLGGFGSTRLQGFAPGERLPQFIVDADGIADVIGIIGEINEVPSEVDVSPGVVVKVGTGEVEA